MIILVHADGPDKTIGTLTWTDRTVPCALGRTGVCAGEEKREGDGKTPIGIWPLRRVFYRDDRLAQPATGLACRAIAPEDGWCDDPNDTAYNQLVTLPFKASHERLWRDDNIYDVVVELGHNDDPPRPGYGSAIFLHVARDDYTPTEGCVAISRADLLELLTACDATSMIDIKSAPL